MNHLAHFFLAYQHKEKTNEAFVIGNFIADFIKNNQLGDFSEDMQRGVQFHRRIDTFTDAHPMFRQSSARLHADHHKYSPVVTDVFYDFLLAKNWDTYEPPFPTVGDFAQSVYQLLIRNFSLLPDNLKKRIDAMISDDWLMHYISYEGLERTFHLLEKIARFPGNFHLATANLKKHLPELDKDFNAFFPEIIEFVQQEIVF